MWPVEIHYLAVFFEGASQFSRCGCGVWLKMFPNCHYKIYLHGRNGTNMQVEILACWGLLWFASQFGVEQLWVYGDSKVLIEYLNKGRSLNPGNLRS